MLQEAPLNWTRAALNISDVIIIVSVTSATRGCHHMFCVLVAFGW
jgi:hypothetical protein